MATYGIETRNADNHILISSDVQSFHYLGTASYVSTTESGLTDFPNFSDSNTLSGRHTFLYQINVPYGGEPLVFIRPGANNYAYGVLRKWRYSGNNWRIEIIQRGTTARRPSTILVFYQLKGVKTPAQNYGLITKLANGDIAFDAARNPLSIRSSVSALQPTLPCDGGKPTWGGGYPWRDKRLDFNFKCNTTFNSYNIVGMDDVPVTDIAFTCPSLAQAVYSRRKYGYKKSCGTYSCQSHWSTSSWWVMYYAAYHLYGRSFRAGWSPYQAGFHYWERAEDGGIGGGSGGSSTYGNQPYQDKSINLASNGAIFIDAGAYL